MSIRRGGYMSSDDQPLRLDPRLPETRISTLVEKKEEPKDRLLGATIDGFKILNLIGEGGFSRVYKVSPEKLDNQYFALKFVPE